MHPVRYGPSLREGIPARVLVGAFTSRRSLLPPLLDALNHHGVADQDAARTSQHCPVQHQPVAERVALSVTRQRCLVWRHLIRGEESTKEAFIRMADGRPMADGRWPMAAMVSAIVNLSRTIPAAAHGERTQGPGATHGPEGWIAPSRIKASHGWLR